MSSSVKGRYISVKYHMHVTIEHDGDASLDSMKSVTMPIKMFRNANEKIYGNTEESDITPAYPWNPVYQQEKLLTFE